MREELVEELEHKKVEPKGVKSNYLGEDLIKLNSQK